MWHAARFKISGSMVYRIGPGDESRFFTEQEDACGCNLIRSTNMPGRIGVSRRVYGRFILQRDLIRQSKDHLIHFICGGFICLRLLQFCDLFQSGFKFIKSLF